VHVCDHVGITLSGLAQMRMGETGRRERAKIWQIDWKIVDEMESWKKREFEIVV
jgi:hypothetical protein